MARTRRRQANTGADNNEADDCGDEEDMQTEAEGIVAWHGRKQYVRYRERWPLF